MKRIALLIALAMASSAWAQAPTQTTQAPAQTKDPAKPATTVKQAAKPEARKSAAVVRKSKRTQDARHCLERANNTEIIKCAEPYL